MINKINYSLLTCLLVTLSSGCILDDIGGAAVWQAQCIKVKKEIAKETNINVIYSPLPTVQTQKKSISVLKWEGLSIPIPKSTYTDVYITQNHIDHQDDLGVKLVTKDGLMIFIDRYYQNGIMDDPYATSNITEPDTKSAAEWQRGIEEFFFGKPMPMRMSDFKELGFTTTLDDVNCQSNNLPKESMKLQALVLKGIYSPSSVHKSNLNAQHWIASGLHKLGRAEKRYWVNIVEEERNNDTLKVVDYFIPKEIDDFDLHAMVSNNEIHDIKNPAWVDALNEALESRDKTNWETYFTLVKENGISEKSINKSRLAVSH